VAVLPAEPRKAIAEESADQKPLAEKIDTDRRFAGDTLQNRLRVYLSIELSATDNGAGLA
jgi:hypothetical protein